MTFLIINSSSKLKTNRQFVPYKIIIINVNSLGSCSSSSLMKLDLYSSKTTPVIQSIDIQISESYEHYIFPALSE